MKCTTLRESIKNLCRHVCDSFYVLSRPLNVAKVIMTRRHPESFTDRDVQNHFEISRYA